MKVLFISPIQSTPKYHHLTHFTSDNAGSKKVQDADNKRMNNSLLLGGGLALLGAGFYIWKHKSPAKNLSQLAQDTAAQVPKKPVVQKQEPVVIKPEKTEEIKKEIKLEIKQTPLPDEKLANSFPQTLRSKLSVNNNYEKLKKLLLSPDKASVAGEGANSVVYNIDFLDDYVLKIIKSKLNADPNNIPIGLFPDSVNLGQPVWVHPDNKGILLLKKVSGKPNSIENWSGTIYDKSLQKPLSVTREQAYDYYGKITRIAQMEQASFDDLANQIKVLDTTPKYPGDAVPGFKTDSVNPNNLLVDFENNRLGVIDYFAKNNEIYQNSYMDMVAVISDFTLYPEYYDHLMPQQQAELLKCLKIIEDKSFKAAQKAGLSTDKNVFLNFINKMNKYFPIPSVKKSDTEEYIRSYDVRAKAFVDMFNSR